MAAVEEFPENHFLSSEVILEDYVYRERYARIIASYTRDNKYDPLSTDLPDDLNQILDTLTSISGIQHNKELLDFWCIFFNPGIVVKGEKFKYQYKVQERLEELLDVLSNATNVGLVLEDVMFEITMLIGDNYNFSVETILTAAEVLKGRMNRLAKEFAHIVVEEQIRSRDIDVALKEIINNPEYPNIIPKVQVKKIEKLFGVEIGEDEVRLWCEEMDSRNIMRPWYDESLVDFLQSSRYGGCYESILMLPRPQRVIAVNLFYRYLKKDLKQEDFLPYKSLIECAEQLKALGADIKSTPLYNLDQDIPSMLSNLRYCVEFYKNPKRIGVLTPEGKIKLMQYIFAIRGAEFKENDLSEREITEFLESCAYDFRESYGTNLLSDVEYDTIIDGLDAESWLTQRALFSGKKIEVHNIPGIGSMITYGLEEGQIKKLWVEIAGPPAVGKSTILSLLMKNTNAYIEEEVIPAMRRLCSVGITGNEIIRFVESGITFPDLLNFTVSLEELPTERLEEEDLEVIAFLSWFRKKITDNPVSILAQDVFNQTAFFNASVLGRKKKTLREMSNSNVRLRDQYLRGIESINDEDPERATFLVVLLAEVEEMLKRRKHTDILNPEFLPILLSQYLNLYYDISKPTKNHPPIAILAINTGQMSPSQCTELIIQNIHRLMGENASSLMREA